MENKKNKKNLNKIILLITILTLTILITGCTQTTRDENELLILASTFPLYEFAKEIAPNDDVRMMVPPGVDIHHYDLKPSDLILIEQSDLIIFIGEDMEPWLDNILQQNKYETLQTSKYVNLIKVDEDDNHTDDEEHTDDEDDYTDDEEHTDDEDIHESEYDPHIWLDFDNSIEIVNAITLKLSEMKIENAETYKKNADEYIKELQALNEKFEEELTNCEIRHFITSHNAFNYFANKYNLTQIPIRGLSAEQEPSPKVMTEIINEAKKYDIKHVFFEELTSPRVSQALANELDAEVLMLTPAENIPAKDFGQKTFIDVMNQNLENLKKGLRCN